MSRADGLDPYVSGLPREWVERLANSDETTDSLEIATRIFHKPTLTPAISVSAPGLGPQPVVIGNVIGLHYDTPATDAGFRIIKIPTSLVSAGNARQVEPHTSFHVHWTKGVDTDQSAATVRWVLDYTVFDGRDDELTSPIVSNTVNMDDTYVDAGTTTRVVYRTPDFEVTDLVAGYYLGVKVTNDSGNSTIAGGPVLVSADLLWRGWLNV